ncbi:MAG: PAS domain S-box protein [Bacteroidetes bacterium]|nr:PAS domain S-box protein [Bacteroidota bacterium]
MAQKGYRQVFDKGFVSDYPLTIKHKNGKLTDVLYNASVYKDNKGNVLGVFAAARDITAQKQSSQYARRLIEASLDPLVTISAEGKITDVNEASVKVTGIKRNKLIGTDFSDYFTEPLKAKQGYKKVFDKGFVADYPLTIKNKNGKLIDVLYNASIYKDDKGNVLGVFAAARDVTEQKWSVDLRIANKELAFQNKEKEKRANELSIANKELAFQNNEKEKRANELSIANKELAFQNNEKEKRAIELGIANKELAFQNNEKEKRAAELLIANEELAFQNEEKEKRADELSVANKELAFQNNEKEKRANELSVANKELAFQNNEKEKRAAELLIANKELAFQNNEKEKRANELGIANKELAFQNNEKEKRANELSVANKELAFQNGEKGKRATELSIANKELAFQNNEKEKRAAELVIANKELVFQTGEKEKRAAELVIADKELEFQNKEREKREIANKELEAISSSLKLASQYSLSLIEASRDPLFTISTEGKITDLNQATVKVTGVSRDKLINSDFCDYFTNPKKAQRSYQQIFKKGFVVDFPLTIKDGKLTDVLFNGSVYKNDSGEVIGAVVVARDITEQNIFENELTEAKIFAELATTIAEEAKIKAESATSIAENAVKAKQQFLSNMSHEIRTPMNAIIGFTKVLLKTNLTDKQKEYLNAIRISGNALIVLINDILDLAKVDAGKMTFEQTPFIMADTLSSMLHLFEIKIQEKNLLLIREYDDRIPDVLVGDPVRLHQIILNLVSNAVKFTRKGSITVSVRLLKQDKKKVTLEFSVADTGIGITATKIPTIFDDFQQATSDTSRLYGGTGLGLAIVKQLIEPQGGSIQVQSTVDVGSVFSFTLSFGKTDKVVDSETLITEIDDEIKNIKVLVVEDIALNQLLMKTLLDDFGFDRDIADNGKVAIEKLKTKDYDIILMDLQMPVMNGFETTDYIRNTLNSKIPIIALTADVTTVDLAKCKAVGMDDYIAKPIDERVLYTKIIGLVAKPTQIKPNEKKEIITSEIKKEKCTDLTYLNQRTKSNPELMMEMITLYLEQTTPLIKTMKQGDLDKDWPLLQAAVHKMIPSFSIVGIHVDFENLAKKIQEYASTQQQTELIHPMVLQLENICNQACIELEEEFNTIKNNNE